MYTHVIIYIFVFDKEMLNDINISDPQELGQLKRVGSVNFAFQPKMLAEKVNLSNLFALH